MDKVKEESILGNDTKVLSPDNILYTQIEDDEIVILDLKTGKYFSLNSTAANIFKLFVKYELTFREVIDRLIILYPEADEYEMRQDVKSLAEDLKKSGIFFY